MVDKSSAKKISISSTKQEMLDAYNALLQELQEKMESELKPEERREEKKIKEVLQVADSLSTEGIIGKISNLKLATGKMLTQISDNLEEEVKKFEAIKEAVQFKEKDIQELYQIEKAAATLAALIESQNLKRAEFESEMAARKEKLEGEIQTLQAEWEKEKKAYETQSKEWTDLEKKRREREKEEYLYAFEREQKIAKDRFEDEKAQLEKEIQIKREQMEKELQAREKVIAEKEAELNALRNKVSSFPEELETTVNRTVKEAVERIKVETKSREDLFKKEFDGERNVLTTKIAALEKTVKDQSEQIARLSQQLEKAYQKIEDIAVKTIEGSAGLKTYNNLQQLISEQVKKQAQEK